MPLGTILWVSLEQKAQPVPAQRYSLASDWELGRDGFEHVPCREERKDELQLWKVSLTEEGRALGDVFTLVHAAYCRGSVVLEPEDPGLEGIYFSGFSFSFHFYREYFFKMALSENLSTHFIAYTAKSTVVQHQTGCVFFFFKRLKYL